MPRWYSVLCDNWSRAAWHGEISWEHAARLVEVWHPIALEQTLARRKRRPSRRQQLELDLYAGLLGCGVDEQTARHLVGGAAGAVNRAMHDRERGLEFRDHVNGPAPRKRPGPGIREGKSRCSTDRIHRRRGGPAVARRRRESKSYRSFPLGLRAGDYLRAKRRRLTEASYRDYESCLDKLARYFADLDLHDLEPPVGTERLEEFLDYQWGTRSGRTFNKAPLGSA
jgi:hypothetical protein